MSGRKKKKRKKNMSEENGVIMKTYKIRCN